MFCTRTAKQIPFIWTLLSRFQCFIVIYGNAKLKSQLVDKLISYCTNTFLKSEMLCCFYSTQYSQLFYFKICCLIVTTMQKKLFSYLSFRDFVHPGRWKLFPWRRRSCEEPATGSGDRISSFCLLWQQKDLLFPSTCITRKQPASYSCPAALSGGRLVF